MRPAKEIFDLIIVGAGAAGLCLACKAGEHGLKTLLLDGQGRAGRKLLLSGGGKCNVTNLSVSPANYLGEDAAFCKAALQRLQPVQVIDFLNRHGLAWEERDYGQIFLKQGAERLRDLLLRLAEKHGAVIVLGNPVLKASRQGGLFRVESAEQVYQGRCLALCTGSPAWPASGANASGYALASAFGHTLAPPRPALAPLPMPEDWPLRNLAGINLPVCIFLRTGQEICKQYTLPLLITHQGFSGPAALQISSHLEGGEEIGIDWLPEQKCESLFNLPGAGKRLLANHLSGPPARLPLRLVEALLPPQIAGRKVAELSRAQRNEAAACIHDYRIVPDLPGFERAEACRGGVRTDEINPCSMESLLCPGLFFAGEIMDICGELGGYNLHWAWSSSLAAADALVKAGAKHFLQGA